MSGENDIPVNAVVALVDRVTAPVERIKANIARLTKPVTQVNAAFGRLGIAAGLPGITAGLRGVNQSFGALGSQIKGLVAPAAALTSVLSIAGLTKIVKGTADYAGQIDDMSQRLGVGKRALQEWLYAAKFAGIEQESLESSLSIFNRTLGDVGRGKNKNAAALFTKLGISVKAANGSMKSADQILPEVADAIARIQNPIARNTALLALFGKSGADLAPLLKDGAGGIRALAKEAARLGIIMSDEEIERGAKFGDEIDRVVSLFSGLGNTIGSKLLPTLTPLIEKMIAFVAANRDLIAQKIGAVVEDLAAALQSIDWLAVLDGVRTLGKAIGTVVDFIGGWKNAAIGIIAVMNAPLISSIVGVIASVGKLGVAVVTTLLPTLGALITSFGTLTAVLLANPLTWVVAAGIAAGLAAVWVVKHWDEVVDFFKKLGSWIYGYVEEPFNKAFNNIKEVVGSVADWIMEKIGWLTDGIGTVMDLASKAGSVASGLGNKIAGFGSDIANGLGNLMPDFSGGNMALAGAAAGTGAAISPRLPLAQLAPTGQVDVRVDFRNVPAGTEVKAKSAGAAVGEMEVGRSRRNTL